MYGIKIYFMYLSACIVFEHLYKYTNAEVYHNFNYIVIICISKDF